MKLTVLVVAKTYAYNALRKRTPLHDNHNMRPLHYFGLIRNNKSAFNSYDLADNLYISKC